MNASLTAAVPGQCPPRCAAKTSLAVDSTVVARRSAADLVSALGWVSIHGGGFDEQAHGAGTGPGLLCSDAIMPALRRPPRLLASESCGAFDLAGPRTICLRAHFRKVRIYDSNPVWRADQLRMRLITRFVWIRACSTTSKPYVLVWLSRLSQRGSGFCQHFIAALAAQRKSAGAKLDPKQFEVIVLSEQLAAIPQLQWLRSVQTVPQLHLPHR